MRRIIFLATMLLLVNAVFASKIIVSGQLNSNTVWSADTVIIENELDIENGVELTIKRGVKVFGGYIKVKGAIIAIGTSSEPIQFLINDGTVPGTDATFKGILWENVQAGSDSSIISNCHFEKYGTSVMLEVKSWSKVAVRNCVFDGKIIRNEMFFSAFSSNCVFSNNLVKNFSNAALFTSNGSTIFRNNVFDSCLNYRYGKDLIGIYGGKAKLENNLFTHCGDSLNPSDLNPLVQIGNDAEPTISGNVFKDNYTLCYRIESGAMANINGDTISQAEAGILLSNTHTTKPVLFRNTFIEKIKGAAAVYAGIDCRANFINCEITNCLKSGVTVVRDSEFSFNKCSLINNQGGGIYVAYLTTDVVVEDCYFEGNSANYGGGLFISDRSNSRVTRSTFKSNLAANGGGLSAGSGSVITGCVFMNNQAYSFGGGAFVQGCTFTNNQLINNESYMGGGMLVQRSNYYKGIFENNYLGGNTADSLGGGAIIVTDQFVTFRNNHLENNSAAYAGGGLSIFASGKTFISGLLINNNEARFGAGFNINENANNEIRMSNLSVANNLATGKYAAFHNISKDELFFTNCVFWGNESDKGLDFYSEWDNLDPWFTNCVVEGGQNNFDLNGGNYNGTWTNNLDSDPFFNNPIAAGIGNSENGSYYFPANSVLNDGGKADTSGLRLQKKDLTGTTRVKSNRIDIGALEFLLGPSIISTDFPIAGCEGNTVFLSVTAGGPAPSYTWIRNSDTLKQTSFKLTINDFSIKDTGNYYVIVSNPAGYTTSQKVNLQLAPAPVVSSLGPDTNICISSGFTLSLDKSYVAYEWNKGSTLPTYQPKLSDEYWVTVYNDQGCSANSDTIVVQVTIPAFVKDVNLTLKDEEWRIVADLQSKDGYDSIIWFLDNKYYQTGTSEFIVVSPTQGEGNYNLVTFYKGCANDTSESIYVLYPNLGAKLNRNFTLKTLGQNIIIASKDNQVYNLRLSTLNGKTLKESSFCQSFSYNYSSYNNHIVLLQVFDKNNRLVFAEKIYVP